MNQIKHLLGALAGLFRRAPRYELANGITDGRHSDGRISFYTADAAHTERNLLVKRGASATSTAICGAADTPIGVSVDEPGAGERHTIRLFSAHGTTLMVASAAIAQDALVEPAANGRIATLGAGAGNHHIVGRAITAAAAAGEIIEVDQFYNLRVI